MDAELSAVSAELDRAAELHRPVAVLLFEAEGADATVAARMTRSVNAGFGDAPDVMVSQRDTRAVVVARRNWLEATDLARAIVRHLAAYEKVRCGAFSHFAPEYSAATALATADSALAEARETGAEIVVFSEASGLQRADLLGAPCPLNGAKVDLVAIRSGAGDWREAVSCSAFRRTSRPACGQTCIRMLNACMPFDWAPNAPKRSRH